MKELKKNTDRNKECGERGHQRARGSDQDLLGLKEMGVGKLRTKCQSYLANNLIPCENRMQKATRVQFTYAMYSTLIIKFVHTFYEQHTNTATVLFY